MEKPHDVAVLLVEDNPRDAELVLRILRKRNLADHVVHLKDGQQALEWLFGTGAYAGRDPNNKPRAKMSCE